MLTTNAIFATMLYFMCRLWHKVCLLNFESRSRKRTIFLNIDWIENGDMTIKIKSHGPYKACSLSVVCPRWNRVEKEKLDNVNKTDLWQLFGDVRFSVHPLLEMWRIPVW